MEGIYARSIFRLGRVVMQEEYWEAQIEGFEKAFKKPIWRDYLETQRELLDKVFKESFEEN